MNTEIKIFVDFLNSDKMGRVRLTTNGTKRDLLTNNIELKKGLELLLDDGKGNSAFCIVDFSEEENIWVGIIDQVNHLKS
jgi:hypothetical protein